MQHINHKTMTEVPANELQRIVALRKKWISVEKNYFLELFGIWKII